MGSNGPGSVRWAATAVLTASATTAGSTSYAWSGDADRLMRDSLPPITPVVVRTRQGISPVVGHSSVLLVNGCLAGRTPAPALPLACASLPRRAVAVDGFLVRQRRIPVTACRLGRSASRSTPR